jgi:signal transduction histidine kinase
MDARRRRKDGREIDLLISGAPLRRADGSINGAVGTWLDVTEQRAVERQLRHAQRMEAVGQLTGGVAHDFNNLLAIVIGTLDLLLQQLPADGEPQELVNQAIEAAERGAALTRRLLAFARQQTLRPVATGINALIAGMQPLLQRAVGEPIVITLQAQADLWPARVDPGQLEHAILNLAVNARDAMPQGGTLAIATFNTVIEPDNTVDQTDATAGDYVCIRVSDSGTGIPPDTLPRVFEPFFTTKEVGQGSGLGLSMVFGFVKQSGGQVRIDSELGAGTSVTLYLPRAAG